MSNSDKRWIAVMTAIFAVCAWLTYVEYFKPAAPHTYGSGTYSDYPKPSATDTPSGNKTP